MSTHVVETNRLAAGERLRVVHVSDLHLGLGAPAAKGLAALIREQHADVLVFTGDAVNTDAELDNFHELMRTAAVPVQVGVRGNHDSRLDLGRDLIELTGEPVSVRDGSVFVCGAPYFKPGAAKTCWSNVDEGAFRIFAFHAPDLVEEPHTQGVDLYLAGHTHGGQVRLPFFGAAITMAKHGKKYEMGRYQVGTTTLYVNRGVGVSPLPFPPIRLLCPPELTVIDVVGTRSAI